MNARALIAECERLDVELVVEGHRLLWRPVDALDAATQAQLRGLKFEVIAALYDDLRPLRGCWGCGANVYVTIVGRPSHLWFCDGCQGPYPPERVADRWRAPLRSLKPGRRS